MKPLTKKQRRDIYWNAAIRIFEEQNSFCCPAIRVSHIIYFKDETFSPKPLFDEFNLFDPKNVKSGNVWFGRNDVANNQNARINALLLCAEMCK